MSILRKIGYSISELKSLIANKTLGSLIDVNATAPAEQAILQYVNGVWITAGLDSIDSIDGGFAATTEFEGDSIDGGSA